MDYSKGKIYKLVNNVDDKIYVGSTTNPLYARLCTHKNDSKKYPNRKVYYHINEIGGWNNISIILIEEYPCENREQLNLREKYWFESLKPDLNFQVPARTQTEYREDNKNKIKDNGKNYRNKNKSKIEETKKKYYDNNLLSIQDYKKKYYDNNKDHILEKSKINYEKNKEFLKIKYECICGSRCTNGYKLEHEKTIKHQKYIDQLED